MSSPVRPKTAFTPLENKLLNELRRRGARMSTLQVLIPNDSDSSASSDLTPIGKPIQLHKPLFPRETRLPPLKNRLNCYRKNLSESSFKIRKVALKKGISQSPTRPCIGSNPIHRNFDCYSGKLPSRSVV